MINHMAKALRTPTGAIGDHDLASVDRVPRQLFSAMALGQGKPGEPESGLYRLCSTQLVP
jgi:hypothetical protein